jgi:uncharacterized membrane protein required for colicin V production
MNWLDIVILVTMVLIGFLGWRTGVIKAVFGAVGVVAGIFLAGRFSGPIGDSLDFITNENLAKAAGFVIVFAVIFVVAMVAAKFLRKLLKLVLLGWVDGLGGAGLGLVAGALLWVGLIGLLGSFPIGSLDKSIEGSSMATLLADKVPFGLSLLPEEYKGIRSLIDRVRGGGDVTVEFTGMTIERVTASRLTLVATLDVANPSESEGTITLLRYLFQHADGDNVILLDLGVLEGVPVAAETTTQVKVPLDLGGGAAATQGSLVQSLIDGESATFRVEGTVAIELPSGSEEFEYSGEAEVRAPQ